MKKINSTIRVTELDAVSDAIVRIYKAEAALKNDEYLKPLMSEIEGLSARITKAVKSDKSVSSLDEADRKRDEVIRSLGKLLTGYSVIPTADKKAAGEKLLEIFERYKGIIKENFASESSLIESMLTAFADKNLAPLIEKLEGVSYYISALRSAEDDFKTANDEFTQAASAKTESATLIRKPLLAAINDKLLPYIETMNTVKGGVYSAFHAKMNEEIERMNKTALKRRGAKNEGAAASPQAEGKADGKTEEKSEAK